MNKNQRYYLGLDIGTNSVGYAVTDENYKLIKHKNEPMWGSHVFEEGSTSSARRSHRIARRLVARRKHRVQLVRNIFEKEIAKIDDKFYKRIDQSSLFLEDKELRSPFAAFDDKNYTDVDYNKKYPTIHHLICDLMDSTEFHDPRLVYIAVAWLVKHRGHFLNEVDVDKIDDILCFHEVYSEFMALFDEVKPWECEPSSIEEVLKLSLGITAKKEKLCELFYSSKKAPKTQDEDKYSREGLVTLLAGGSYAVNKLFNDEETTEDNDNLSFRNPEKVEEVLAKLDCEKAEFVTRLWKIYDWSLLVNILKNSKTISEAKIKVYNQHKKDLAFLKKFIKTFLPNEYLNYFYKKINIENICQFIDSNLSIDLMKDNEKDQYKDIKLRIKANNVISKKDDKYFKQQKKDIDFLKKIIKSYLSSETKVFQLPEITYVNYSNNLKNYYGEHLNKVNQIEFCESLSKLIADVTVKETDELFVDFIDMKNRLENNTFMPKQVNSDNRVIPYQLYYYELRKILEKASTYLPFLKEESDGLTNTDKLLQILRFRIPYFVGPLNSKSPNSWLKRKDGCIYPWNFDEIVDLENSENEFIRKMTNKCTYLPEEDVIPKNSLLYCKFNVLNEINNLRINGESLAVELKQKIYTELFVKKNKKVTASSIKDFIKTEAIPCLGNKDFLLSGIDETIKSSLRSYHDFKRLIESKLLSENEVEEIIERLTISEDKFRIKAYLDKNYSKLPETDRKYISKLKYSDFGRLSRKFLTGIEGVCKDDVTGEFLNIIDMLWNKNENLMHLLSDRYTYSETLKEINSISEASNTEKILEDMYVGNAVKRPIYRTLDIIKDVVKVMGSAPTKIFIEMARGAKPEQKGKRTKSRKEQIKELYASLKNENTVTELNKELDSKNDNELQRDALFLYFMQLGKCMYSGNPIRLNELNTKIYDIDHIYPQCLVKDDSLLNNKVLVLSEYNGTIKKDNYPIPSDIQKRMLGDWTYLHNVGLINDEKFKRLTRSHKFTDDEKIGFINRQLVETQQSTKAIATILGLKFPKTEIVYVKAKLASDLRQYLKLFKCRAVNDLHHAKDAYLNIVCGNVYDTRFSKRYFDVNRDKYSLNIDVLFGNKPWQIGEAVVWQGSATINLIKKTLAKNNVHYTRYAFCRKHGQSGGLFDQNPLPKSDGLIPLKKGKDPAKYGGYNGATATCFLLVKYSIKKKMDIMVMPVDLMKSDNVFNNKTSALEYSRDNLASILGKNQEDISNISFPLGLRKIKVNTVLLLDGYPVGITGKSNGGKILSLTNMLPLALNPEFDNYCKSLVSFNEKKEKNSKIILDSKYDGITSEYNIKLYDLLIGKLNNSIYQKAIFVNQKKVLEEGRNIFVNKLSLEKQLHVLLQLLLIYNGYKADLTDIGGSKTAGAQTLSTNISNWKKNYKTVNILDQSASGLYESKSQNLLDLL